MSNLLVVGGMVCPGPPHLISEDSMKIRVRIEPKGTRYRKTGRTHFAKMTSMVNQPTLRSSTLKESAWPFDARANGQANFIYDDFYVKPNSG